MQSESDQGSSEIRERVSQSGGVSQELLLREADRLNKASHQQIIERMESDRRRHQESLERLSAPMGFGNSISDKLRERDRALMGVDKRVRAEQQLRERLSAPMGFVNSISDKLRERDRALMEVDKRARAQQQSERVSASMQVDERAHEKLLDTFQGGIEPAASLQKKLDDARSRIESLQSKVKGREAELREVIQERDSAREELLSLPKSAKSAVMLDRKIKRLLGQESAAVVLEGIHDAIDKKIVEASSLLNKLLVHQLEELSKSVIRDVFEEASPQLSIEDHRHMKLYDKVDAMIINNEPWSPGAAGPLV